MPPSATLAPPAPRPNATPRARLVPAPRCEPAYEEDGAWSGARRAAGTGPVQGTLALAFTLPTGLPAVPAAAGPHLAVVPAPTSDADEDEGPRSTPTAQLPDAAGWAGRYVQAALEVLSGERPVGQLVRWTSARVYSDVSRRTAAARDRQATPARTTPAGHRYAARLPTGRPVVRSVHVSAPADGVAEVSAVVARGGRVHAVALRLEGLGGRWQCTAFQVG